MANNFTTKQAQVVVTTVRPDGQGGSTTTPYTFIANRMKIRIRDGGANFGNTMIEIFGVPLATMNQIARLYLQPLTPVNTDTVSISVWDGYNFVPLFQGVVSWSAIRASGMPHVSLIIESNSAFALTTSAPSPYSNPGPVLLKDALAAIVAPAGYTVDYAASAPTYSIQRLRLTGSPADQVNALMRHFPDLTYNTHLQALVVRPANQPYDANAITISAPEGMQFAPEYGTNGVTFATVFNPQIRPGTALKFDTQFTYLNQTQWIASVLQHELEPNVFKGKWTSSIAACSYGTTGNAQ